MKRMGTKASRPGGGWGGRGRGTPRLGIWGVGEQDPQNLLKGLGPPCNGEPRESEDMEGGTRFAFEGEKRPLASGEGEAAGSPAQVETFTHHREAPYPGAGGGCPAGREETAPGSRAGAAGRSPPPGSDYTRVRPGGNL